MKRNQTIARDYASVDLTVGLTEPNEFGLFDMHGNVEEWCLDWYGAYDSSEKEDPRGPEYGEFKVTRGGSHHTPVKYLRSTARMAMLPTDRHSLTGFRIVEVDDSANNHHATPLFTPPVHYVIKPSSRNQHTPFYNHNHQPAIAACDNGDLIAVWFSTDAENNREMVVLSSRLKKGETQWSEASLFYKVPGRNMTGTSLLNDGEGRLLHINGVEAAGDWQNLALVLRESTDNGESWSNARIIAPEHSKRHQAVAGPIVTSEGWFIQVCDAGPGGDDGAAIIVSRDKGLTWSDPWDGEAIPEFADGASGSTIAGIHAGIAELDGGKLVAFGRGNSITDSLGIAKMPMSVSTDYGRTWTYHASSLPPISGGQRLVLLRLAEGPLLMISFTEHPERTPEHLRGMVMMRPDGELDVCHGMYAALSFDEGLTWPIARLISDGSGKSYDGGAWTGTFVADMTHGEPKGYLAATQTNDGTIHLLSSSLHYRFNIQWLMDGSSSASQN